MSGEPWRPFQRTGKGTFTVTLGAEDREVLKLLPAQLSAAVTANPSGPEFKRLFPVAFADDQSAQAEYRDLVGTELETSRAHSLGVLSATAEATELSADQMDEWLRALNDIRLWLGTALDVGQDSEDEPDDPPHLLYQALTYLQGSLIDAMMGEEDDEEEE